MHDMGMVHSDIKTQNFFVKFDGRIFLGDYSLAHVSSSKSISQRGIRVLHMRFQVKDASDMCRTFIVAELMPETRGAD